MEEPGNGLLFGTVQVFPAELLQLYIYTDRYTDSVRFITIKDETSFEKQKQKFTLENKRYLGVWH